MSFRKIFTPYIHEDKCHSLKFYQSKGGYEQARKALNDWQPDDPSKRSRRPIFVGEAERVSPRV